MDLQGLGAFLSALGGIFTAKAGATAGKLQGLLTGEDITERRKRMQMAEEAHQLQKRLAEAEEARRAELFPLTKRGMEQQIEQSEQLFPLKRDALATQVEMGKLNLENTRLWTMYQRGVVPSQIADPVLRQQYEPFFNYMNSLQTLENVQTPEDLEKVLATVPEEWRGTLEIAGRFRLFRNQMQKETAERHLKGLELNLALGELHLRSTQLNNALSLVLGNIDREGLNWDKRTPEQKIQAVQKWLKETGLDAYVPEGFANMFQNIQSTDARQYALLQLQTELQLRANSALLGLHYKYNSALQQQMLFGNLVFGAVGQGQQGGFGGMPFGGGGLASVGFPALPAINIFKGVFDNNQSNLNEVGLRDYLKYPADITVPFRGGTEMLSALATRAGGIYRNLARPNAKITAEDINTLIAYDAGLIMAKFAEGGMGIDWRTAFAMAKSRVIPALKGNRAYQTEPIHYAQVIDNWEQWWVRNIEQGGSAPRSNNPQMPRGTIGRQSRQQNPRQQNRPQTRPSTGGRIQTDRLDRQS
jgi:hypothetical protein